MTRRTIKTIAYLEDDVQQSEQVATLLRNHGYRCYTYSTATSIQDSFKRISYDAVLLDWELNSELTGLDVLKYIRKNFSNDLPLIMFSAKQKAVNALEALSAGANEYLSKPVDKSRLLNLVDEFCYPKLTEDVTDYGSYIDDKIRKRISIEGSALSLSSGEYSVLSLLLTQKGRWVTSRRLLDLLEDDVRKSGAIGMDLLVHRLKRKIRKSQSDRWQLEILQGQGCRLIDTEQSALTV